MELLAVVGLLCAIINRPASSSQSSMLSVCFSMLMVNVMSLHCLQGPDWP